MKRTRRWSVKYLIALLLVLGAFPLSVSADITQVEFELVPGQAVTNRPSLVIYTGFGQDVVGTTPFVYELEILRKKDKIIPVGTITIEIDGKPGRLDGDDLVLQNGRTLGDTISFTVFAPLVPEGTVLEFNFVLRREGDNLFGGVIEFGP